MSDLRTRFENALHELAEMRTCAENNRKLATEYRAREWEAGQRIRELKAENERLREIVRQIAAFNLLEEADDVGEVIKAARRALEGVER